MEIPHSQIEDETMMREALLDPLIFLKLKHIEI